MKKILMCFGVIFLLAACTPQTTDNPTVQQYQLICDELLERQIFDSQYDFKVTLTYNVVEDGYRYDIVIDEPTEKMNNVIAVATTSHTQYAPSIGLFDDEPYHISQETNKKNNIYKGLLLSGMTSKEESIFIYVSYQSDNGDNVVKYIEVENK